jgi:hypothetical protein
VIAVLALFISLGGVAYAVVKAPKNSVVTTSIKRGAVTLPKIAKSAKTALKGQTGAPGTNGTNGATNVVVRTATVSIPNGFALNQKVQCNAGERAVGGGIADPAGLNANSRVVDSAPLKGDTIATAGQTPTGWLGEAFNGSSGSLDYTVYVICASP